MVVDAAVRKDARDGITANLRACGFHIPAAVAGEDTGTVVAAWFVVAKEDDTLFGEGRQCFSASEVGLLVAESDETIALIVVLVEPFLFEHWDVSLSARHVCGATVSHRACLSLNGCPYPARWQERDTDSPGWALLRAGREEVAFEVGFLQPVFGCGLIAAL